MSLILGVAVKNSLNCSLATILVIFHIQHFPLVYDFAQDVSPLAGISPSATIIPHPISWAVIIFTGLSFSSSLKTDKEISPPEIFSVHFILPGWVT